MSKNIDSWNVWRRESTILSKKQSTSSTSLSLTSKFKDYPLPELEIFQHEFQIQNLREILESKTAIQKEDFRASLQKILDENLNDQAQADYQRNKWKSIN